MRSPSSALTTDRRRRRRHPVQGLRQHQGPDSVPGQPHDLAALLVLVLGLLLGLALLLVRAAFRGLRRLRGSRGRAGVHDPDLRALERSARSSSAVDERSRPSRYWMRAWARCQTWSAVMLCGLPESASRSTTPCRLQVGSWATAVATSLDQALRLERRRGVRSALARETIGRCLAPGGPWPRAWVAVASRTVDAGVSSRSRGAVDRPGRMVWCPSTTSAQDGSRPTSSCSD
jgi:hypothetical protein